MKVEDFLKQSKSEIYDIKYGIEKIKEKQDGAILYLNNSEKINISIDNYFKYSLNNLKGIDQNLYDILKKEERIFLGYLSVLRKLSVKDYTIKQISDFLIIKKELNENEAKQIVEKLINIGLLNDENYCKNRIIYLNKQLLSQKQIKIKLIKEGISEDLIRKYVINNSEDELNKAIKMAEKVSCSIKNKSLNATKQKIMNKLVNCGYSYEDSKNAVNELNLKINNEIDLLKKEYIKAKTRYGKKYEKHELKNHIYIYLISKGFNNEDIKKVMEDQL